MAWTPRTQTTSDWQQARWVAYYLLNEDGTYLLNEDGTKILLQESNIVYADWTPRIIPT